MNDSPKYVVSSTLRDATWSNSEIVGPYTPEAIRRVKEGVEGGIYISGSGTLAGPSSPTAWPMSCTYSCSP